MTENYIYDFAAIGIGPFNLGLACLTEPIDELNGIFLDQSDGFNWHPGMLLQDTTLQIPFIADLVTLADPTNKFSFLNYLKTKGKLYSFYIRENFLVLRNEYNLYCQWVTDQLPNLHFQTWVESISCDRGIYLVKSIHTATGDATTYRARKLVLGTGTSPYIPGCCEKVVKNAIHSSAYLYHKKELQKKKSITIMGSGQSAAEIYYDLLQEIDEYNYKLNWITRSPRFFPLEYSKLTLEMTSPEYVDYFYNLPPEKREHIIADQKHLYKGINMDLINDIFDLLYTKSLDNSIKTSLRTNSSLEQVIFDNDSGWFDLKICQQEQKKCYSMQTEGLILATGYTYKQPEFIKGIKDRIKWDDKNRYDVNRNYSIDIHEKEIFVQNAELHTHGFVTPDLGMACYRNSCIIREMTGKEYYPVERRIAFQQFGAPVTGEEAPEKYELIN